jgi:hypothetical protein
MGSKSSVHIAVMNALYNDDKVYDPAQVMNASPYSYITPDMMRDFLLDVAHELATDNPPATLNVDSLDIGKCMTSTVNDLENYIYLSLPRTA